MSRRTDQLAEAASTGDPWLMLLMLALFGWVAWRLMRRK